MSDEDPKIARIRKLVMLATDRSASDSEARTSAVLACQIFRSHEIVTLLATATDGSNETRAREAALKACRFLRTLMDVPDVELPRSPAPSSPAPQSPSGSRYPYGTGAGAYGRDPWAATGQPPPRSPPTTFGICKRCRCRIEWGKKYCETCGPIIESQQQKTKRHSAGPIGIWYIACDVCELEARGGADQEAACLNASAQGFRVVDGQTMCPGCIDRFEKATGRKVP